MMNRIKDNVRHAEFQQLLDSVPGTLPTAVGLTNAVRKSVLAAQLVDSVRRIAYLNFLAARSRSPSLHTPYSGSFEPLGGGASLLRQGRIDDAYWLVYLATHFGKHKTDGWNLTEDFYGRFGQVGVWDWATVSHDPQALEEWLAANYPAVTFAGRSRRFGNHRKFETLKPGPKGTGHALRSYVEWVMGRGSHRALIESAQQQVGQNPQEVFGYLYSELDNVSKLGRLGKFDLLCNWSNLMIAPIFPDKAYVAESTGPKIGAKLLFGSELTMPALEAACTALSEHLDVSPQAVEDALCNWQKSPESYIYFRG
jgi:hypothetical protein